MAPGPARILPPRARANPSRERPLGAFAQTISARAHPNPGQRPRTAFLHERIRFPHVRTRAPARSRRTARTNNPRHARTRAVRTAPAGPSEGVPGMHVRTQAARCRCPYPPPRTTRPNQPRAAARTYVLPARTPNPSNRPYATSRPAVTPPTACRRRHIRGTPLPVRPRCARASVLARPLFHHPPVCLKTVTTPSTPRLTALHCHATFGGFSSYMMSCLPCLRSTHPRELTPAEATTKQLLIFSLGARIDNDIGRALQLLCALRIRPDTWIDESRNARPNPGNWRRRREIAQTNCPRARPNPSRHRPSHRSPFPPRARSNPSARPSPPAPPTRPPP